MSEQTNWVYYKLKNDETLKIREVTTDDTDALLCYIEKVSGESDNLNFGRGEFGFSYEEEFAYLQAIRSSENAIYLLGYIEDQLVSALSFSCENRPRTEHVGEFGVTVLKAHWGLGIGEAMLVTLVEWAKISGIIGKINLTVRADNLRAIALYEKVGFIREGYRTREMKIDGVYYDGLLMGIEIDQEGE